MNIHTKNSNGLNKAIKIICSKKWEQIRVIFKFFFASYFWFYGISDLMRLRQISYLNLIMKRGYGRISKCTALTLVRCFNVFHFVYLLFMVDRKKIRKFLSYFILFQNRKLKFYIPKFIVCYMSSLLKPVINFLWDISVCNISKTNNLPQNCFLWEFFYFFVLRMNWYTYLA